MKNYLFVHFKEKSSPDGEQVYFALSRDGFNWESVNDGRPVLWAYYGDKGARDFTVARLNRNGREKFYILATDLSLSYGMRNQYHNSWEEIGRNGSKCLSLWESDNLVDWKEQRLIKIGTDDFGCMWAPDVIADKSCCDFIVHWSSSHRDDGYREKKIWYCRTKDFETFTEPEVLYGKAGSSVIDSAMYEEDGKYYLFVKSESNPARVQLLVGDCITGPFSIMDDFSGSMESLQEGVYEAPTAVKTDDGKWCLFLDFYGVRGAGQGYVPFVSDDISSGKFVRSDASFSFPYGFKHGTVLAISDEEYERIRSKKSWEVYS